ncbi:DUF3168 domain-containing protein [Ralstonia syzygii subsp. celebesensis]|uniref:DUF3168 domain-containing protein n=2 Tax=Ralstonia syzygii subsp. celebesensis TaxID=1310168 RepID=A0A1U9VDQ3_9RALS|nr:DUF3168 domain-containing protein [Ralstonia syzygii]AQW28810.1 hypothetical protein B0B51_01445 [blood disease bacterium A2-HR MARDI]QQV54641.1 DUF3168 domain-containing protein [Ralstonia syzygii subsp. celebesensis]CCA79056.1 conserved hypothetical protein [blood disease bacterium R229]
MANSAHAIVSAALKGLVGGRCYPSVAPEGVGRPFIVYQSAGGQSANYLGNTVAGQKNARMQIAVWADTQQAAIDVMQQVDATLSGAPILATSIGAPVDDHEADTRRYGQRLDFSIWYSP